MLTLRGECWVITDASAGNQRQALALAEQLQMPSRHLLLEPRPPWSWLAPRLTLGRQLALPASQRAWFAPPWPAVAIGCGRAAALFTRMLRPLSAGRCHTVQILDPRLDPGMWDTVIAPRHDGLEGGNVLRTLGSLNPVDSEWLADGRDACPEFDELPQPRVGVLLGGTRHGIALDAGYARDLARHLLERQRNEGGSLLVLTSRRTPAVLIETFRPLLKGVPGLLRRLPGADFRQRTAARENPALPSGIAGRRPAARHRLVAPRCADSLARNRANRRVGSRQNPCCHHPECRGPMTRSRPRPSVILRCG
jgi:hypothetical protein